MDITKIKQIIELFESSALAKMELEIEEEDIKISMEKPTSEIVYTAPQQQATPATVMSEAMVADVACGEEIKSPLVGTYYEASGNDAKPFVVVGQKVKQGDVLCIIEAMKAMNEICAHRDGVVTSICGQNGKLVQFDEVLMHLE